MLRPGVIGIAGLLSACVSIPPAAQEDASVGVPCADQDDDGWFAGEDGMCEDALYFDCADGDPESHPGALELDDGASDRDCDGVTWDGEVEVAELEISDALLDLQVIVGDVVMRFDAERGHSLASLEILTSGELLYDGPMNERLVGVEAWESFFSYTPGGDIRTMHARNPAVLRFQVDWSDGTDMNGTTMWTIHAGGRIYRRDQLILATQPSGNSISAYVALEGPRFDRIDFASNATPITVAFPTPGVTTFHAQPPPDEEWVCAFHTTGGYQVGLLSEATASSSAETERATIGHGCCDDTRHVSLQYDWYFGGPTAPTGSFSGNFQIVAVPGDAECAPTIAAELAWRDPPTLALSGGGTILGTGGEDEDGDGFAEGGGYYAIQAGTSPFEIELINGIIWETVTFRVDDLPAGDPVILIEQEGTTTRLARGPDYMLSREGPSTWLVIRALVGDTITIVSPPS